MKEIWNEYQVANLEKRQLLTFLHPYTCACHREDLIATKYGWKCPVSGEIVQEWALAEDLVGRWLDT